MSWLLYVCLDLIFTLLCYLTNWFVVIFADEKGQLPKVFKLWQTYDNPLDIRWQVLEVVPKFLRYDFDSHYIYHYEMKGDGYMRPGFVQLWYNDFTTKERVQRYFCRLLWLMRNNAYGFGYYVTGRAVDFSKVKVLRKIKELNNEQWFSYVPGFLAP